VEVVRGAESALYGTDAVAGVIQVFTHRGNTRTPELSLFGEGGSFSTGRGGGQISGLLGASTIPPRHLTSRPRPGAEQPLF